MESLIKRRFKPIKGKLKGKRLRKVKRKKLYCRIDNLEISNENIFKGIFKDVLVCFELHLDISFVGKVAVLAKFINLI